MAKVLLCGAVNGRWEQLLERVKKLCDPKKTTSFDMLICVGKVFPLPVGATDDDDADAKFPIPTYVVPACEDDQCLTTDPTQIRLMERMTEFVKNADGSSQMPLTLAPNCFFWGQHGVATLSNGLKVAYLSGSTALDKPSPILHYDVQQEREYWTALQEEGALEDIDFFFSAEYPQGFQQLMPLAQVPSELQAVEGSESVRMVMSMMHPKYHIVSVPDTDRKDSTGVFYQRLPYVSTNKSGKKHITRLIGLSEVNSSKDKSRKYLHALSVTPVSSLTQEQSVSIDIPAGTTENPYLSVSVDSHRQPISPQSKRRRLDDSGLSADQVAQLTAQSTGGSGGGNQFFYDPRMAARGRQANGQHGDRRKPRGPPPIPERTECWFCLATPSVERHLIVSIGEEAYLAIPKGAINEDHILIVPIAHKASSVQLSRSTWDEIERFKKQLRAYFDAQDKEMIVMDRNVATIGAAHAHLQVVGIPRSKATEARTIFESEGEKYRVHFQELRAEDDLAQVTDERPFFYVELPNASGNIKSAPVRLLHLVDEKHYMQFGRHAAAHVLDLPRRANWKFCVVPKAEEADAAKAFKARWAKYDFTLE